MWKPFSNNRAFFINFIQQYDYELYVTDYNTLWFVRLTEIDFENILKECNPTLEIDDTALKNKGIQMLLNPDKLRKAEVNINGTTMHISMSMSFGYSIKLNLSLNEASAEMFFQKVTKPLLTLVQDLKSSEDELRHLLRKKDIEIEEYKNEAAQIARHFKTSKFNEEQHMDKHKLYSECFGNTDVPRIVLEHSVEIPEVKVKQEKEPVLIIKPEPSTSCTVVKTEPETQIVVKTEPETQILMKTEPETQIQENDNTIQATVRVKMEQVKTEPKINDRKRLRARLNL